MSLFRFPQTYYQNAGSYDTGDWVATPLGPFVFYGTIQPDTGKEDFPKETGHDDIGRVNVISTTRLTVGDEGGETKGDLVLYGGRWYCLDKELPYLNRLIPHYTYSGALEKGFAP